MPEGPDSNTKITVHRFADPDVALFDAVPGLTLFGLTEVSIHYEVGMCSSDDRDKLRHCQSSSLSDHTDW